MKLIVLGRKRFCVLKYITEKPYKVSLVGYLRDKLTDKSFYRLSTKLIN